MKHKRDLIEKEWLSLLEQAIKEGVNIQVNHRFKYDNKNLGTFLTSAISKKNTERIKKIEKLGFNFSLHSRDPELYVQKYILELSAEKNPSKQKYITRFNTYVFHKKKFLKKETIKKLNKVWKEKFGDTRKWKKPESTEDKIVKWKAFRYDETINPEGNWYASKLIMGNLYFWVYARKTSKDKMILLKDYFNDTELLELSSEGFMI